MKISYTWRLLIHGWNGRTKQMWYLKQGWQSQGVCYLLTSQYPIFTPLHFSSWHFAMSVAVQKCFTIWGWSHDSSPDSGSTRAIVARQGGYQCAFFTSWVNVYIQTLFHLKTAAIIACISLKEYLLVSWKSSLLNMYFFQ